MIEENYAPLTGNIYKEIFYDQGQRYVNYYVDCAECGREIGKDGFGRGRTLANAIKRDGWGLFIKNGFAQTAYANFRSLN